MLKYQSGDNMVQMWTYALSSADIMKVTTSSQKVRIKPRYITMIRIPQHPKNGTSIQWYQHSMAPAFNGTCHKVSIYFKKTGFYFSQSVRNFRELETPILKIEENEIKKMFQYFNRNLKEVEVNSYKTKQNP